ncbi:MAG TPA: 23S rRNA (pseudouridine(1915)-N(3))-methyltransferase RlmH, partial [Steroidobacteraceae bacterium]|nr:23S rRNA (pseudouridine(1915)-N(3))-methyltransferase RlmH [Steroidobacteraceae bacterium]
MKCRLIAAGTRLPEWAGAGFRDYQRRLRRPMTLDLIEIPVAPRRAGEPVRAAIAREGEAMLAAVR